ELAAELGISAKVRFCGFLSQPDLRELYATSHFFIHPSETPPDLNQEGIPNSVLEAMATGLPVLGTRHGGIPEAVEHGRGGLLVQERDFEALSNAMKTLARSGDGFREMGLLGSERVVAEFEIGAQVRQLERYYDEATGFSLAAEPARTSVAAAPVESFSRHVAAE
ncbi:MAG: glycosyltransferase, partial [Chthoniobacterales bacterium]